MIKRGGQQVTVVSPRQKAVTGVGSRTVTASRLRNTVSRKDRADGARTWLMERYRHEAPERQSLPTCSHVADADDSQARAREAGHRWRKPNHVLLLRRWVRLRRVLSKAVGRDKAAVLGLEPAAPVR